MKTAKGPAPLGCHKSASSFIIRWSGKGSTWKLDHVTPGCWQRSVISATPILPSTPPAISSVLSKLWFLRVSRVVVVFPNEKLLQKRQIEALDGKVSLLQAGISGMVSQSSTQKKSNSRNAEIWTMKTCTHPLWLGCENLDGYRTRKHISEQRLLPLIPMYTSSKWPK